MSTILKALRRLEEEREVEAHDLRGQVLARPRPHPVRPRLALLVASGAVGAVLVVGGFVFLQGRIGAPRPGLAGPPAAPRAPRAVAAPPNPARAHSGAEAAVRPAPVAPARPAPVAAARPAPVVAAPVRSTASVSAPPPPPSAVSHAPAFRPPAPPSPVPADAVSPTRPGIAGQPQMARHTPFPHVVVERTLWHPKPARRVAFLRVEGRSGTVELHEGDAVGDAVVQQIAPSAVIFLHRGVEIRRRVGVED